MKNFGVAFASLLVPSMAAAQDTGSGEPVRASVTADPVAVVSRDRVSLVVSGSYSCEIDEGTNVFNSPTVSFDVRQASGNEVIADSGNIDADCDGEVHAVSFTMRANKPWRGGLAHVDAAVAIAYVVNDQFIFFNESESITVNIRR